MAYDYEAHNREILARLDKGHRNTIAFGVWMLVIEFVILAGFLWLLYLARH